MRHRRPLLLALIATVPAFAQDNANRMASVLTALNQTHQFRGVTLSPDTRWVTWSETAPDGPVTTTYLKSLTDLSATPRVITGLRHAPVVDYSLAWSPDSTRFAFLAKVGDREQREVFTMTPADVDAHELVHVKGFVTDLRWSPDSKQLGFLYAENGGGGGPLEALATPVGEVGAEIHNQRITTVAAEGGVPHPISDGNLNVYEFDWSPDGKRFAAIAAPGPADNNWWTAKLYTVAAASGAMDVLYTPPAAVQIAIPRWSPDSTRIAFIGGLMSDEGFVGGDIYITDVNSAHTGNLTEGMRQSASSLRWTSHDTLLFTAFSGGGGTINTLQTTRGEQRILWQGTDQLHDAGNLPDLALSGDAQVWAAVRSDWAHPPEVWLHHASEEWKPLTQVNAASSPLWGKAESITWHTGTQAVQGWLLYPSAYDPSKRYPMVVSVHGGPSSAHANSWPSTHFDMSALSALGYFVLFPNPRGSYGQGEAFTRGNIQDLGGGDLKDILAGVADVVKRVPVDPGRVGITGWSYGGYMTMWAVTQTNTFRAAVAGAGIANWQSYYGQNGIDQWMIPFFGKSVYEDPAVYAKSSPITFIKQVKTPTLVIVGENDAECPAPQSFEFWHALHTLDVPTKLIVYPGEGHAFHEDKDQIDRMQKTAAWFDRFLQAR